MFSKRIRGVLKVKQAQYSWCWGLRGIRARMERNGMADHAEQGPVAQVAAED